MSDNGAEVMKRTRFELARRSGRHERKQETKAAEVTLHAPKLRPLPFETAIIERHRD